MSNVGITFKSGTRSYGNGDAAFANVQTRLRKLSVELGDLTQPFDEISSIILPEIKRRFNTGELGDTPYRDKKTRRSRFTRNVRRARGQDPDGPTLKASGDLQAAVERKKSPTKNRLGGQREVRRLVIGINSGKAPYYRTQLEGGTWEVPVRIGKRGGMHFDPDRVPGSSMSSSRYWGPRQWVHYAKLPEGIKEVQVPATNIFYMHDDDAKMIRNVLLDWAWRAGLRG